MFFTAKHCGNDYYQISNVKGEGSIEMKKTNVARNQNVRDIMSSSNLETKGDILNDIPIQIKNLSNLRDEGIISDEEFSTKKTELLSRI